MPDDATQSGDPTPPTPPMPQALPAGKRFLPPSVVAEEQRQSQQLLLLVVRLLFLVLLVTVTLLTAASRAESPDEFEFTTFIGLFIGATAVGVLVLVVDAKTPNKRLTSVVGVYLGICVGLIMALAVGALLDVVAEAWDLKGDGGPAEIYVGLTKVVIAIVICYLAVSVVLTTKDDFRLVIPYVEFAKQVRGVRPLLLDTSVLIDGRIESLGQTGFIAAPLVVPQFVLDELQTLSDSSDKLKRTRGRRGLHVLGRLQTNAQLDVSIDSTDVPGGSVDHKLLALAADQNMRVLTTDYNLDKVAEIKGVAVLNVNEMAQALKPQVIPGENLRVEIVKRGEAARQGVGYLPDGTMVVIEEAAMRIGEEIDVTVTNSLQTSAGRMIFGRLSNGETPSSPTTRRDVAAEPPVAVEPPEGRPPTATPTQ